ncbi:F-box only protein 7-like [Amphiura filiformis]|uniref:F-box only protein 7-like n=1 Tax=Amphiura filiformis TaxID=82378 RepID=UPI003B20BC13
MKLRLRLKARTERVQLDEDCSLGVLRTLVAQIFELEPDSFELSLNGRDALPCTDESLPSQFDIVSGDLIRILTTQCDQVSSVSSSASSHQDNMASFDERSTVQQSEKQEESQGMDSTPGCSQSTGSTSAVTQAVVCRLNEPMLCREATDKAIPLRLRQLLKRWQSSNQCEILCIALHVLMLETGFVAKLSQEDVECNRSQQTGSSLDVDMTSAMPSNWKSSSAAYKITYTHPMCQGAECSLAWVPMGPVLLVHALTTGQTHLQLKLTISDFIANLTTEHTDDFVPFRQLQLLSRQYKDSIAHPLLGAVRAELGLAPLHGLMALVPEIQLFILSFLDAASLLRMSEVCTHFHSIATDASLWRQLVLQDYGGRVDDVNGNWRQLYKQKYQAHKEMEQARSRILYPPLMPPHHGMVPPLPDPMHPMYPPGYRGGDYDLDPFSGAVPMLPGGRRGRLPNAGPFPGARHDPIFPESDFRLGRGGGLRDATSGRSSGNRLFPGGGGFRF